MERINKFKKNKIENMQEISGGREVSISHDIMTGQKTDKSIINNDGCLIKQIDWVDGKRYVTTHAGDCSTPESNIPVDSNY